MVKVLFTMVLFIEFLHNCSQRTTTQTTTTRAEALSIIPRYPSSPSFTKIDSCLCATTTTNDDDNNENIRVRLPRGVSKHIRKLKANGQVEEAEAYYAMELEKARKKKTKERPLEYGARYTRKKQKRRLPGNAKK